jgi:hypothetical protein
MLNQAIVGRRRGGFGGIIGQMVRWFIMVAIYDICIGVIASTLGISRFAAIFVFLGIMLAGSAVAYIMKQRMSPSVDGPYYSNRR